MLRNNSGTPGCIGALPLQYCESCNAGDTCGVGANTCTGFECRCELPSCTGATPFCVSRNGISVVASVPKMATVLETQAVNIARQIIPVKIASTRDSTAEIRLFAFKAVNLMAPVANAVPTEQRKKDAILMVLPPTALQIPPDAGDAIKHKTERMGAWATGMDPFVPTPRGIRFLGVVWHVIHRSTRCELREPPICGALTGQCRACNPDAQQNECPEDNVCQQDGTCVED